LHKILRLADDGQYDPKQDYVSMPPDVALYAQNQWHTQLFTTSLPTHTRRSPNVNIFTSLRKL
jgi:hypothetical protein